MFHYQLEARKTREQVFVQAEAHTGPGKGLGSRTPVETDLFQGNKKMR